MKIVSTSYTNTRSFTDPEAWLDRINFYTGILGELAKQHNVESIEQINYTGRVERNGVIYHFLNFTRLGLRFPFKLHKHIRKLKPDVIFVNGFIYPFQVMLLRLALGRGVKIIILHRSEKPFKGIKGYLQKWADKSVDAYLFSSHEFGQQWMEKGIISDREKIHEIIQASSVFQPTDKDEARSALSLNGSPVYLWVGHLDENKDPVTVVKAFKEFLRRQPSCSLYLIYQGDELLPGLKSLAGGESNIHFVGRVKHDQLQHWFNSADFFISGSHYEGNGIAACEAMSCGCIPILTDIFSFRGMTGRGKCGLLYEPGNEKKLLEILLQTKEMDIEQESKKALRQFREELSFEAIAKKINKLLGSLRSH